MTAFLQAAAQRRVHVGVPGLVAARIEAAGWRDVTWRNLSGGIVAVHRATRPVEQ